MKKLTLLILALICVLGLGGCTKEVHTITDFSDYSDMTRETNKIEVEFDIHSGYPFCFTIEEQEDIDEIMDIVFSSSFMNMGKEMYAGASTVLTIIQGEKEYHINVSMNKEGENYYSFETNELQLKIYELAREAGLYEGIE